MGVSKEWENTFWASLYRFNRTYPPGSRVLFKPPTSTEVIAAEVLTTAAPGGDYDIEVLVRLDDPPGTNRVIKTHTVIGPA